MQTQLNQLYHIMECIDSAKKDIIEAIETSVNMFIAQKDDKETFSPGPVAKLAFKGLEDNDHVFEFETRSAQEPNICSTVMSFDSTPLGVFRFEDGDFDMYSCLKPETQEYVISFINIELKNRRLNEMLTPLLYGNNVYDLPSTINTVTQGISRFGIGAVVIEGSVINTVNIVSITPHDILASSSIALDTESTHTPALISITLIELTKAVLFSMFDEKRLHVVDKK